MQWTSWSLCSSTCGLGWKTRSQPCDQNSCQEFSQEKKRCNVGPCPIDGGLSEWGPWSSCSVTCGVGTETRLRTCSKPPPQFGGADCRDPTTSKRTCSLTTCRPKGTRVYYDLFFVCIFYFPFSMQCAFFVILIFYVRLYSFALTVI